MWPLVRRISVFGSIRLDMIKSILTAVFFVIQMAVVIAGIYLIGQQLVED